MYLRPYVFNGIEWVMLDIFIPPSQIVVYTTASNKLVLKMGDNIIVPKWFDSYGSAVELAEQISNKLWGNQFNVIDEFPEAFL